MALWTAHLDGGPKRVNHAASAIGDNIFMFGGYCSGGDYISERPIDGFVFSTKALKWSVLPPYKGDTSTTLLNCPYMRYGHSVVSYNDKIYLWGGRNDTVGADPRIFQFDPETIRWSSLQATGDIPSGTDGHSACVINNSMYLFGGFVDPLQIYSNMVFQFDMREKNWRLIQRMGDHVPQWRDFHTATAVDNQMVVFGGRSDTSGRWHTDNEFYCNKVWLFDTRNQQWAQPECKGEIPQGRRSHSSFTYQNHLYVYGGYNSTSGTHFNDLYKLNLTSYEWSKVEMRGRIPRKRRRQCCVQIEDKMYMFGGTSPRDDVSPAHLHDLNHLSDLSDLHVLDFAPTLKTMCKVSILENKIRSSVLPTTLKYELKEMRACSKISSPSDTQQG